MSLAFEPRNLDMLLARRSQRAKARKSCIALDAPTVSHERSARNPGILERAPVSGQLIGRAPLLQALLSF